MFTHVPDCLVKSLQSLPLVPQKERKLGVKKPTPVRAGGGRLRELICMIMADFVVVQQKLASIVKQFSPNLKYIKKTRNETQKPTPGLCTDKLSPPWPCSLNERVPPKNPSSEA